jgi:hypothetical protein
VLHELQQYQQAISCFDQAIRLSPDYAAAYFNLGLVYQEQLEFLQALVNFEKVIAIDPQYEAAFYHAGNALLVLGQLEIGLGFLDRALQLNPESTMAHTSRANALKCLWRIDEALDSYATAIALRPDYHEPYCKRGILLQALKRLDEAMADYQQAIDLKPDFANAYWNKGLLKILTGQFAEGWQLYEWRWQDTGKLQARSYPQPLWLGDADLNGKTLLIFPEQGFGDIIQFCRYLPLLDALGANIIFEVPAGLLTLLGTLPGRFQLVERGSTLPEFDLYCPIMSLALAFKTTLNTIPASVPYLFADDLHQAKWQQRLGEKTAFRVGLVWSGSKAHPDDRNRSMSLPMLSALLELPVEFHCLQKEIHGEDQAQLAALPQIHTHSEALADFADTAALLNAMDLIISVDTSVAHLAGAMAKPVWILLPYAPDYRWMLDRTDSPWYPTATLFRQPAPQDWAAVMGQVVEQLQRLLD